MHSSPQAQVQAQVQTYVQAEVQTHLVMFLMGVTWGEWGPT
jgi:hypothetical protein